LYREYLEDARFFVALRRLDDEIAAEVRGKGCPRCGGRLHVANYPRQPRGLGFEAQGELALRLSLCCGREGCRGRVMPPSVRFFGRRWYVGVTFLLVSALLTERLSEKVLGRIEVEIGVSFETLVRWRKWWREQFVRSRFWQGARGRFSPGVRESDELVAQILERFGFGRGGDDGQALVRCLRFLSPLTTGSWARTAVGGV